MPMRSPKPTILWLGALALSTAAPIRAELFSLSASGTINFHSSLDTTIAIGTPWEFEIIYDTAAPDRDFELVGEPDPNFGRFNNRGAAPAIRSFHYRAGTYEVTIDDPTAFGPFSEIIISFGGVHAIDINIRASGLFPPLGGGPVFFHADFNDLSRSSLSSDALPTNTTLGLQNFQDSSVTLLPQSGGAILGSESGMTGLKIVSVPEPATFAFAMAGLSALLRRRRERSDVGRRGAASASC